MLFARSDLTLEVKASSNTMKLKNWKYGSLFQQKMIGSLFARNIIRSFFIQKTIRIARHKLFCCQWAKTLFVGTHFAWVPLQLFTACFLGTLKISSGPPKRIERFSKSDLFWVCKSFTFLSDGLRYLEIRSSVRLISKSTNSNNIARYNTGLFLSRHMSTHYTSHYRCTNIYKYNMNIHRKLSQKRSSIFLN